MRDIGVPVVFFDWKSARVCAVRNVSRSYRNQFVRVLRLTDN